MATIYDVAKLAGVSAATVSHVMNESRFVSEETKQKVLQAMETLRYRRDAVARSLRRSETGTIGLVISDITNPYFSDLVRGVEDALYRRGENHSLVLCNTDEDAEKEKRHDQPVDPPLQQDRYVALFLLGVLVGIAEHQAVVLAAPV